VTSSAAGEARGKGAARRGVAKADDDDALPPTVFEVEEAKRKAKRRAKKDAKLQLEAAGSGNDVAVANQGEVGWDDEDDDVMPSELSNDPFFAEALAERDEEERRERRAAGAERAAAERAVGRNGAAAAGATGEPKRKGKKGKRGRDVAMSEEEVRRQAELELLMVADDEEEAREARRGFNAKALELPARAADKGVKGARKRRAEAAAAAANAAADEGGFELDLSDSRFASVYRSSEYAIDPTDPKFRRTAGSEKLLSEIQRRHRERESEGESTGERLGERARPAYGDCSHSTPHGSGTWPVNEAGAPAVASSAVATGSDGGLWRMVASVKAKAAKLGQPNTASSKSGAGAASGGIQKVAKAKGTANGMLHGVARAVVAGVSKATEPPPPGLVARKAMPGIEPGPAKVAEKAGRSVSDMASNVVGKLKLKKKKVGT